MNTESRSSNHVDRPARRRGGRRGSLFIPKPLTPGERFGCLTVIEAAPPVRRDRSSTKMASSSLFQCDCGEQVVYINQIVRRGDTTSCGCRAHATASFRKVIPSGTRFGLLNVIEAVVPVRGPSRSRVKCDCGTIKTVWNANLKSGRVFSCGCRRHTLVEGSNWNRLFAYYRHLCAEKRGLDWRLSLSQFARICSMPCAYCAVVGANTLKDKRRADLRYNGLDRLDSAGGYILGNVLPSCPMCNYAKNDYSLEEFIDYLRCLGSSLTTDAIEFLASRLKADLADEGI
jgi:hypothetical protein